MPSRLALVGLLVSCHPWSSSWGYRPIGWQGSIPSCDHPKVVDGTAFRDNSGYLVAVGAGQSLVHCADDTTVQIGAKAAARVTIEGPVRGSSDLVYEVHVFAGDGDELALQDMANEVVWAVSVGSMNELPRCSDHGFGMGCGDTSRLRELKAPGPGVVMITATLGSVTGSLGVTVTP